MARLSLKLVFIVAGLNFTILKLTEAVDGDSPRVLAMVLCLPAAVLGAASWLMVRSFARSWPLVLCVVISWVGLLHAAVNQSNRGLVEAVYLTMILPIAALIVEYRCWWSCARIFVQANACALGLALWFEYQAHGNLLAGSLRRFGFLMSEDGATRLANPNMVGGQLAMAAVLAFLLYLRGGRKPNDSQPPAERFSLGWTVFLSLGCILTGSRGAFLAWFASIGLLLWRGTGRQQSSRLKDFVATAGMLLAVTLFLVVAAGFQPWKSLQARFDERQGVLTASGRFELWQGAVHAWQSNPRYLLIGTGSGAAPEAIGKQLRLTESDGITPAAMDAHNVLVEWGLSHGLLGMVVGICLAAAVYRQAHRLDCRDRSVARRAILLCFFLSSMNYVTVRDMLIMAAGPLILSMVSQPSGAASATPSAQRSDVRLPVLPTAPLRRRRAAAYHHQSGAIS